MGEADRSQGGASLASEGQRPFEMYENCGAPRLQSGALWQFS